MKTIWTTTKIKTTPTTRWRMKNVLPANPWMMTKASDMSNMKNIEHFLFMTGNDNNLDKEWTMKMTWTMTTTTTRRKEITKRKNMLTMILQMTMRASNMMKYIYPYVFMTGNDDDVDEEWTMNMIWTMTITT